MSGRMPCASCNPPGREARGHHLVEDQNGAGLARQRAQIGEELAGCRDAAAAAEHRLDEDRGEIAPVRRDEGAGAGDVVVFADQKLERRVDLAALAAEIEDAAVIAALEDQHLGMAGQGAGQADRHQIGLGAAVGEAHQLDRRKARADRRRKARLGGSVRAEIDPAVEGLIDRAADQRVRMAEDSGGELAEEIDVFVAVGVPQMRALALHHRQRERLDKDRRAGVAAGQRGAGLLVLREALWVARAVLLLRLSERRGDIDIGGVGRTHRVSSGAPVVA